MFESLSFCATCRRRTQGHSARLVFDTFKQTTCVKCSNHKLTPLGKNDVVIDKKKWYFGTYVPLCEVCNERGCVAELHD